MFREMRRKKQLLSEEETVRVFENATSGTLALLGEDDYPYAVPISYVYADGKIFFHSAMEGHKIDAIKKHEKASFCVIAKDRVIPEKYTTDYRSAIAFGRIRIVEDEQIKYRAIKKLAEKYVLDDEENIEKEIEKFNNSFCMIVLEIEHMTGKGK
ncbi:MAG: pyridoxamine 5'-phosphate oxidase family protein [Clostridiales bacterium]|nr:pyridoxamine 5'-phosphate oxidase family protein [Clostridiales bacterium]